MTLTKCQAERAHFFRLGKALYNQFIIRRFFSTVFVIFVFLPLFSNWFISFCINFENTEKRAYAFKPELNFSNLSSFPQAFEAYYNDHFPFRNLLMQWNSIVMVKLFKVSPVPSKVLIGKKGWFYYVDNGALDNYRRVTVFSEEELNNIRLTVEKRNAWLKSRGIAYYLVFVPEKQTVYPEFMPDFIKPVGNISKLDQVVEYLRKNSTVNLIDIKGILSWEKKGTFLYSQIDSHWNVYGAFIVSRNLLSIISKDFPGITSFIPSKNDFYFSTLLFRRGDLTDMLALGNGTFSEKVIRLTPKDRNKMPDLHKPNLQRPLGAMCVIRHGRNAGLPRMLMIKDSFAINLIPFLSECFSRSVYIFSSPFVLGFIAYEKPDIVIEEIIERNIRSLITNPKD